MNNPPPLTSSMRKRISRVFWNSNLGRGATTRVPRASPSDRLCWAWGYMNCKRLRRQRGSIKL